MSEIAHFIPSTGLVPHNMDEALRLAEFMSRARTVPKHLQDSPGDCLMVVELAMRWGMSPFAVAQGTSVISGKLMIEGKLVAAAVEASGAITGHIDYAFTGEGDARAITVSATRRGETNPREVIVALKEARTNNEMWKRQPDQQLVYHGVRVWARRWTPAVILGVYSREEMGPIIEGTAEEQPAEAPSAARQAINDATPMQPLRSAAAATPRAPRVVDPTPYEAPPPKPVDRSQWTDGMWRSWIDAKLRPEGAKLTCRHDVVQLGEKTSVKDAIDPKIAPEWVQRDVTEILHEWFESFPEDAEAMPGDDLDDVVIKGEEHLAAG